MKMLKRYNKRLIRPILYRSVTWGSIALAAVLCWDRFINVRNLLSARRDAFLVAGVFFLAVGWFTYLKIDGVVPPKLHMGSRRKRTKRHGYGDIIDFADEHIVTFDELSDDEQELCRLAVCFLLGCLFLFMSFLSF